MRVALVMPMAPASAIADVTLQALPALRSAWEVEIWCPTEREMRDAPVPVHAFHESDTEVLAGLAGYDLAVYVLGDSGWHSRILPLARALPGLVVLHDASVTGLVRASAIERGDLAGLVDYVDSTYGSWQAAEIAHPADPDDRAGWLRFCGQVPLDDYAVDGSLGVVVHSQWHARRLEGRTLGTVSVAPMPAPVGHVVDRAAATPAMRRRLEAIAEGQVLLVTVGSVNANRHIDVMLDAIAGDPALAARMHLWAVGPAEPSEEAHLVKRAAEVGLADRFTITGWVSDADLDAVLERADVAAALRDPVLEGQSASVLTQMASGTPVVVYDHAHYAELPDDAVVKVDPSSGAAGMAAALHVVADERRPGIGARAREHVRSRTAEGYAEVLVAAAEGALAARAHVASVYRLADRLRRLDLSGQEALVDRVADRVMELFDLG